MMQPVSRPQQPSGDPEYGRYLQSLVSEQQPQRGILRDSEGRPVTSGSGEAVRTGDSDLPMVQQRIGQRAQQLMQEVPEEKRNTPEAQNGAFALSTAENAQVAANAKDQEGIQSTLKKAFGNEEMWLTLALGFNSMRMRPDAGLAGVIGNRLKTIQANKGYANLVPALKKAGMSDEAIAALMKNPELMKAVATKVLTKGFADAPAEYNRVTMALEKAGIKEGSPEYEKAMRILAKIEAPAGSFLSLDPESLAYRKLMETYGGKMGGVKAEEEVQAKTNEMLRSTWNQSLDYLGQKLTGTTTGFFAGLLPAITENQQLADQSVSMMMPLLKDMFRKAGEGVFTDKDQEVLEALVPTRSMSSGAISEALQQIDRLVQSKLRDPRKSIEEIIAENEAKAAPVSEQPMQTTPSAADVKKQAIEEARKRGLIK